MLPDLLLIGNECTVYCLQEHSSACRYRREECPNEGCGTHVVVALMPDHVSSCGYRSVPCNFCYQPVAKRSLQVRHCSLYSADCLSVKSFMLQLHLVKNCTHFSVPCPLDGCMKTICREEVSLVNCSHIDCNQGRISSGGFQQLAIAV